VNVFTAHLATVFVCLLAVYTLNVFDFAEMTGTGLSGLAKLVTIAVLAAAMMAWLDTESSDHSVGTRGPRVRIPAGRIDISHDR
jgi:hypothetical protein